jgi:hypothetical protein
MRISTHLEPFHYICVEQMYNEKELELIWEEMMFLTRPCKLQPPSETSSACTASGEPLKSNKGIFLDETYNNRNLSNILTVNRKLFDSEVLTWKESWFFNKKYITRDFTLLSYYENEDYYESHVDRATVSALTWFFREPRKFEGGELCFTDYDLTIPLENNFTIVFPSNICHEVSAVKGENILWGEGRYCMSQFMHSI